MNHSSSFVCIGAGNVATHLVRKLCSSGFRLIQVYSRTSLSAHLLADRYNASSVTIPGEIIADADFYLVSLPDQVLPDFLKEINIHDKLIFHTAGSLGLEVFGERFSYTGIMYPLQTFTKSSDIDLTEVPFLIEAADNNSLKEIEKIARTLSNRVYIVDSETRSWIHLAAVFACNFTNHMYVAAGEILKMKNIDSTVLNPVIEEAFRKSRAMDPAEAQTGPAVRDDAITIDKHINMLMNKPLLQKIYTFTSQSIQSAKSLKHNKPGK
jgi:predicted short-subunit dehydrogenase-like oxidoreductase (DUF2520 family)